MANLLRTVLAVCVAIIVHVTAAAQSLSVNTSGNPAHASAILDVESTAKGVLVSRMTKTQKNAIASPANGLLVFQTGPDSIGFHYYDLPNTRWVFITASGIATDTTAWKTSGNAGLVDTAFLGTLDDIPLNFRVNNQRVGRFDRLRQNYFIGRGSGMQPLPVGHVAMGDSAGSVINNNFPGVYIGYRSGIVNTATNNTFVGSWAGEFNTTGGSNAYFGTTAGRMNTTGTSNAFLGHFAAYFNTTGSGNTAVGTQALYNDTTGSLNVAVGYQSMLLSRNAHQNTAVGSYSLYSHRFNPYNVAIGEYALFADTSGTSNAALGTSALRFNLDGNQNTAIGTNAMMNHLHGSLNTAIGYEAMENDSIGTVNTAAGWRALRNNKTGIENVAIGVGALETNSTGSGNVALGRSAAIFTDTVDLTTSIGHGALAYNLRERNTALGAYAGYTNSFSSTNINQGAENTMIGYAAMTGNAFGSQNTAIGYKAMAIFEPGFFSSTAPSRNVGIGDSALQQNRGNDNVGIGYRALSKSTTNHHQHVAVGSRALLNATATYPNTAIGYSSMDSTTTGAANTAVGSYSLTANKTGINNVAVGNAAMYESTGGSNNTAVGNDAGRLIRTDYNTAVGASALRNDSTGVRNTALGFQASFLADSSSSTVAVGAQALYYNKQDSNVAVGYRAGLFLGSSTYGGKEGAMVGNFAGAGTFASSKNTALGFRALAQFDTNGTAWDYVGSVNGRNIAIGDSAMAFSPGVSNVAIGAQSLANAGVGNNTVYNVAIGDSAMGNAKSTLTSLYENVAVGYKSLTQVTNRGNVALGAYAARNLENSIWNTALGYHALETDTTGSENTVVGTSAFRMNANGVRNVGLGINTGFWATSSDNTYIGSYAGEGANGLSTGGLNTAVGNNSLQDNTTGTQNAALGYLALNLNTTGSGNTALGTFAGNTNTIGTLNTIIGYNADMSVLGLSNATAIGAHALAAQNNSMVLGGISGINSAGATTSVGIGVNTPGARLHIRRNGASGGTFIVNPSLIVEDNTSSFIQLSNPAANENGILSGSSLTTIRSGIVFGNDSTIFLRAGGNSSKMIIDNTGFIGAGPAAIYPLTQFHINDNQARNVNLRVSSLNGSWEPGLELTKGSGGADWKIAVNTGNLFTLTRSTDDFVTPTDYYEWGVTAYRPTTDILLSLGQSANRWTTVYASNGTINTSDARDKENITDLNYGLNEVMKLRPVSFNWKENPQWGRKIGFIAQELQPVLKEVVQVGDLKPKTPQKEENGNEANASSDKLGVYYSDIIPVTVKAIQEQQKIIEDLKKKNEQLEKDMQAIKAKLGINN